MNAPEIRWAMLKHIDFQGDRHKICKDLRELFDDLLKCQGGDCPHRPDAVAILQEGQAKGSICVYCSQEIEVKRIIWGIKGTFPKAPGAA